MSPLQRQEGGDHYRKRAIQPFEFSLAHGLDAAQHTILKYVTRHQDKGGRQDIEKAIHTLDIAEEQYAKKRRWFGLLAYRPPRVPFEKIYAFYYINEMGWWEYQALEQLLYLRDFNQARKCLSQIIERDYAAT